MSDSYQKWIEAGYELYAENGVENFHVEELARIINLNKSGFYHYFTDHYGFFDVLIEHHYDIVDKFCNECSLLMDFDPGYLNLILKYKSSILVQRQLRRNSHIALCREVFDTVKEMSEKVMINLWAKYLGIPDNQSLALELYHILTDVFYLQLNYEPMTPEFIRQLTENMRKIVYELQSKKFTTDKLQFPLSVNTKPGKDAIVSLN